MEQAFVKNDMMVWCLSAVFIMSLAITGLLIPKILLINGSVKFEVEQSGLSR